MDTPTIDPTQRATIERLSKRYLWWDSLEPGGHSVPRMIAQIMHLGTYDDIRKLETLVGPAVLAEIMRQAAPGWFDDRSWGFWRGRLTRCGEVNIPERRATRAFVHAALL